MNKREAKIAALEIMAGALGKEIGNPSGITTHRLSQDDDGPIDSYKDALKITQELYNLQQALSERINRLENTLPTE